MTSRSERKRKCEDLVVEYLGQFDPTSTLDFQRRVRQKGVIDLCSKTRSSSTISSRRENTASTAISEKPIEEKFSVPGGKRKNKKLYTESVSKHATILRHRWDEGTFRWVHKAHYTPDKRISGDSGGPQNGQLCVAKEFKTGSVYEDHFFSKDILAVDKASEIITKFNKLNEKKINLFDGYKPVKLIRPHVWQYNRPDATGKLRKALCEPMLEGEFIKFNSNSGFRGSSDFMQALSHFSYHYTNGKYLLCDLQGGHYNDAYVLTDPVIMSYENSKKYGSGDLGAEGIQNFFSHHRCGYYCKASWSKPKYAVKSSRIPSSKSTTFSLSIGTKESYAERKKKLAALLALRRV